MLSADSPHFVWGTFSAEYWRLGYVCILVSENSNSGIPGQTPGPTFGGLVGSKASCLQYIVSLRLVLYGSVGLPGYSYHWRPCILGTFRAPVISFSFGCHFAAALILATMLSIPSTFGCKVWRGVRVSFSLSSAAQMAF